ncbi:MAG: YibE/F family protein [Candidatus Dojkabacteria bacterium]|nr:YibE/F family protein [Candidatus Dojkabacteria bacterium]
MKRLLFLTILITSASVIILPQESLAQEQDDTLYKAEIVELETGDCPVEYAEGECYFFKLKILNEDKAGETVDSTVAVADDPKITTYNYKVGQKVYLSEIKIGEETGFGVKEPVRKSSFIALILIFVISVTLIGGIQGLSSLLGLVISFITIIALIIPLIISGTNPILASILGGSIIMTTSIYLSHGFNKKTTLALAGTLIALIITGFLGVIFSNLSQLTGFASEEATFLTQTVDKALNMKGILLASIIIGGIGILDDITVSQASIIMELFNANPSLSWKELFKRSMKVGKDHIASMVNTLVLAYTGSALPIVMLFYASGASIDEITNFEPVAEEIVRTLVGSIGLISAVPITSLIASLAIAGKDQHITARRRRLSNTS